MNTLNCEVEWERLHNFHATREKSAKHYTIVIHRKRPIYVSDYSKKFGLQTVIKK